MTAFASIMAASRTRQVDGAKGGRRMDLLDRLLGHDRWTTGRFLALSRGLTDAQLDQPFDIGHHTVRGTFEHMTGAINFWNELMAGVPIPDQGDDRSIAALAQNYERSFGD